MGGPSKQVRREFRVQASGAEAIFVEYSPAARLRPLSRYFLFAT